MCDTMVVVGDGRVLFAKNSDRDPNEAQLLDWQPRGSHPPGATVRCTHLEIPQARETHAVLLSRPFWMWGAEMGANEHGVAIGNEAVFTKQPYARTGLTGMDLLRLGLERAETARDAVDVITALLEQHGQGGGCGHEHPDFTYHNSFLIADAREAFVVETAGRKWAAELVSAGARSISNGLTIDGFAERHSDRLRSRVSACRARRALTEPAAATATSAGDLMAVLREHGGDGPAYSWLNGGMAAPCMHAGGLVASSQTTASWVAELTPSGARHWATATAAPCTSLFKPVSVLDPVDLGPAPADRYDGRSLWWRHERLHRWAVGDPAARFPVFAGERDATERAWLVDPPPPAEAFATAGRLLDGWLAAATAVTGQTDVRPPWVRRYWRIRDDRADLPQP